jgi:phosphoglycolate phosphatase-like HAD superfamily hydrolase
MAGLSMSATNFRKRQPQNKKVSDFASRHKMCNKMLAIFDNDGTICDTQEVEGKCFSRAVEHVTGRSLSTLDWATYDEPTSSAIVRDLLSGDVDAIRKEQEIQSEFVRLLVEERPKFPSDFSPIPGAVKFIERLEKDNICSVAIATGCFTESARFKLQCCGIALEEFPHATSTDSPRRRDIIPLAAFRAGFDLSSVVYFGDAPWDVRVSRDLGVRLIGIGRRYEQLRTLGVEHTFRDYSEADCIFDVLMMFKGRTEDQQRSSAQVPV